MLKQVLGWALVLATVVGMLESTRLRAQEPAAQIFSASPADKAATRINNTLLQPLRTPLSYDGEQLDIVLDEIAEEYDIPIVFDKSALDEVAISPESELSINLRNISLQSALNIMFKQPGLEDLCYVVEDEVLLITTQDTANSTLLIRVYRADDFVLTNDAQRELLMGASAWADYNPLVGMITACVEPKSWRENGNGEGEIRHVHPGMLVVSQTLHVHTQFEKLFAELRQTKAQILVDANPEEKTGVPVTRGYAISIELGKNADQAQKTIAEAIKSSVDWSAATNEEQEVWVDFLPGRVLVRHIPSVQLQVNSVLQNMQLIRPSRTNNFGRGQSTRRGGAAGGGAF